MSEKLKPKGVPGRRQQNLLYLLVGTIIGAIVAGAVVTLILPKPAAPEPTPTLIPSVVAFAAEGSLPGPTPAPTVIAPRITAVAVSPDGKSIASSVWDMTASGFVEVQTYSVDANLIGDTFQLGTKTPSFDKLAFSPDGGKLAAMSIDAETVVLYDVASHTEQERFQGYSRAAFSPDGKLLILGGGTSGLRLLSAPDMTYLNSITLKDYLQSLAISPDSKQLAVALWDMNTNKTRISLINLAQPDAVPVEYGVDTSISVSDMMYHPSGQLLAVAAHNSFGQSSSVRVFDLVHSSQRFFPLDEMGRIRAVRFDPSGNWLAAAGGDAGAGIAGTIHLWRWDESGILNPDENWLEERILTGHAHDVNSLTFMPDGKYLLSASGDGSLRLWDYKTSTEVSRMQI